MSGGTHTDSCRSCGTAMQGTYCHQCGEKVLTESEKSLRNFLTRLFNEMTSLDGKFIKTLVLMVRKPGEVSYQYMNGRRVPYYKPISMFLVANLVYFILGNFHSFDSSLYVQMNMLPHSGLATQIVHAHLAEIGVSLETFTIQYNQQSTNMAKIFLVLLVVYFSLPLAAVNFNRKMYYSDHLLVSMESTSLVILIAFILLLGILKLFVVLGAWMGMQWGFLLSDVYSSGASILVLLYLFFRIEKRAYAQESWKALLKAALLILFFYFTLQLYRASLFFITMWTF